MSTRDLIDAIQAGDSVAIEQAFQQEMANRIADRLDTMRVEVAKNMFNEAKHDTVSYGDTTFKADKAEHDDEDDEEHDTVSYGDTTFKADKAEKHSSK